MYSNMTKIYFFFFITITIVSYKIGTYYQYDALHYCAGADDRHRRWIARLPTYVYQLHHRIVFEMQMSIVMHL